MVVSRKIVVFGPTGNVGSALMSRLARDHTVVGVSRSEVDLAHVGSLADKVRHVVDEDVSVVINATAFNGMENCERDPTTAIAVNTFAPTVLATVCAQLGAAFIHFSTDYVFNGNEDGLRENDPLEPQGVYGLTKQRGELGVLGVLAAGSPSLVIRLSSVYGASFKGPLDAIAQAQEKGRGTVDDPIQVLRQRCAPTSARLIADAMGHVIATTPLKEWDGLYHFATSTPVWKIDFARFIVKEVMGITPHVVEGTLSVPRPVYSFLRSDKFAERFGFDIPSYEDDFRSSRR